MCMYSIRRARQLIFVGQAPKPKCFLCTHSLRFVVRRSVISTESRAVSSYPSPPTIFVCITARRSESKGIGKRLNICQQQKEGGTATEHSTIAHPNLGAVFRLGVEIIFREEFGADFLLEAIAELRTHVGKCGRKSRQSSNTYTKHTGKAKTT